MTERSGHERTSADGRNFVAPSNVGWQASSMGETESLAEQGLRAVLDWLPRSYTEGASVVVLDSWAESDFICVVYRFRWFDGVLGLRRRVVLDVEVDQDIAEWAEDVANFEIGEPLGRRAHHLWLDPDGTHWWGEVPVPGRTGRFVDVLPPEVDQPLPPGDTVRATGPTDS